MMKKEYFEKKNSFGILKGIINKIEKGGKPVVLFVVPSETVSVNNFS